MKLIFAILKHSMLMVFFQHSGRGLPRGKTGVMWVVVALGFLAVLGHRVADGDGGLLAVLSYFLGAALILWVLPAADAAIVLLCCMGVDLIAIALVMMGFASSGALSGVLLVWQLASMVVTRKNLTSQQN